MMFCPSCGMQAPVDQKFCRSCGFSLEKISPLLNERSMEQRAGDSIHRSGDGIGQISRYVIGGGLFMVLALGFPVVIYRLFMNGTTIAALMLSMLFISLSSALLLYIIRMFLRQVADEIQSRQPRSPSIDAPDTDRMIGAAAEPVSSVAEQTTNRLESPALKGHENLL